MSLHVEALTAFTDIQERKEKENKMLEKGKKVYPC